MPQTLVNPDHWELHRYDLRIIPLLVETYSYTDGEWTATTGYEVVCLPAGTRPSSASSWAEPATDEGATGYLVDGETLSGGVAGNFWGFTRIDGSVQDPVDPAFTLRLL